MAQTKRQIESLLAEAGSHPRHQFGQNFMIDQNLVRMVAEAGSITKADCVIEVGPGTGTLTEELLERAGKVVAVEIDRDLAGMLRSRFGGNPKFRLIEGDALAGKHQLNAELLQAIAEYSLSRHSGGGLGGGTAFDTVRTIDTGAKPPPNPPSEHREREESATATNSVKLVANLPYNIASPLVIELSMAGVECLAFTVQKEVAERLAAKPGTSEYGPLTVMAQLLSRVEILRTLPPQAFWPAPKIESSLVRLIRDDRLRDKARPFSQFVHALFSFRRKTLRKALVQASFSADAILAKTTFDGTRRGEEFSPEQLLELFDASVSSA